MIRPAAQEACSCSMEKLAENKEKIGPVAEQLLEVLENGGGKQAVGDLMAQWGGLKKLTAQYDRYLADDFHDPDISRKNSAQHSLREAFDPFFKSLHEGMKQLGKIIRHHEREQAEAAKKENKRSAADRKTKALKTALEELQAGIKDAESFFKHIHWLQERFPEAEYEDVTGLCKLATIEEIKEQDYSLNPGRYVGVVIEEDGKTEEEFIEELLGMNDELQTIDDEANILNKIISHNIRKLVGEI